MSDLGIQAVSRREAAVVAAPGSAKHVGYQDADKGGVFGAALIFKAMGAGKTPASGRKEMEGKKKGTEVEAAPEGAVSVVPAVVAAVAKDVAVAVPVVVAPVAAEPVIPDKEPGPVIEGSAKAVGPGVGKGAREGKKVEGAIVAAAPVAAAAPAAPASAVVAAVHGASSTAAAVMPVAGAGAPAEVVVTGGARVALSHVEREVQTVKMQVAPADGGAVAKAPVEEAKTIVSTPNVLEVGIANGTHGWLRVRAELGHGGEVQASFVAASEGAAETLHKALPAMSAYLESEQVGVSTLVVNAVEKSGGVYDAAAGLSAGAGATGGNRDEQKRHGAADFHAASEWTGQAAELGPATLMDGLPAALYAGTAMNGDG